MRDFHERPAPHGRPGLTLLELLAAIGLLGLFGLFWLPRLDPAYSAAPEVDASSPPSACPWHSGESFFQGCYFDRHSPDYVGIGASFEKERSSDGYPRIEDPFPGGPAEQAGLESGDLITAVDGIPVQYESTDQVIARICNGEAGSPVRLTIRRSGFDQPLELTITREWLHLRLRIVAE